ncbi:hypothetical protein A6V39_05555 [Candidatus Mycoplasma haematobovis]|uniref:Uncharacterized protein n=1 Tax=Candidatus Mycoplasma haematobovis TaxID=432608 RepID=A0A1A9QCM3_9MOLU|nr:hypothetical protein [Candidatus Mycoplasma haematobovis]OAL09716.1 hypothetical protein A6V39_05555 [Candidatus Mycoplasma haematobovis]
MDIQKFFNELWLSHFCKEPEVIEAKAKRKEKVYEDCLSILRGEWPIRPSLNDKIKEFNFIKMWKYSKIDSV